MLRFNEKYNCMKMELDTWVVCGGNRLREKLLSCTFLSSLHRILSYWMWDRILFELGGVHDIQLIRVCLRYFNIQLFHRKADSIIVYCLFFSMAGKINSSSYGSPQEK